MGNIQVIGNVGKGHEVDNVHDENGIAPTFRENHGKITIVAQRGRGDNNEQQLEQRDDGNTNSLTGVQKDNLVIVPSATKQGFEVAKDGDSINLQNINSKTRRGRVGKGVSQTLDTGGNMAVVQRPARWSRTEKGKEERRKSKKDGKDYTPFSDGARELNPTEDENVGCITNAVNKDSLVFVGALNSHNRGDGSKSRDYSEQDRVYSAELSKDSATINATSNSKYLHNSSIRRLTPIECERLQGFPDDWTLYGDYDGEIKKVPKTQRYKMLGNAVTCRVVEEIGRRLLNK